MIFDAWRSCSGEEAKKEFCEKNGFSLEMFSKVVKIRHQIASTLFEMDLLPNGFFFFSFLLFQKKFLLLLHS